jgi:hypothetical protein
VQGGQFGKIIGFQRPDKGESCRGILVPGQGNQGD